MSCCRVCESSTDGFLCSRCLGEIERALGDLPADLADLQLVATRQARGPLGLGHGHYAEGGRNGVPAVGIEAVTDEPWVFAWGAADQLWAVGNTLSTWVRHICESRGLEPPQASRGRWSEHSAVVIRANRALELRRWREFTPAPEQPFTLLVGWLLNPDVLTAIRYDEAAEQIHEQLTGLQRENHRWIVGRGMPMFAGRCDAADVRAEMDQDGTITPRVGVCGADLYGYLTEKVVRCQACSAEYDLAERKRWMLDQVDEQWAPAQLIADALTTLDEPVNASTLRTWIDRDAGLTRPAERPLIRQVAVDDDGRPLYRVGDVRARIAWSRARRAEDGRVA